MIQLKEKFAADYVHYYDVDGNYVYNNSNVYRAKLAGKDYAFSVQRDLVNAASSLSRPARRLTRNGVSEVLYDTEGNRLVIFAFGKISVYDLGSRQLDETGSFRRGRCPLFTGSLLSRTKRMYFGEYFSNNDGEEVYIFASDDGGYHFEPIFRFPKNSIRHVHSINEDPYSDDIWVCCGDYDGECWFFRTDRDFSFVEHFGDRTQEWRAVSLMFLPDRLVWGIDSPLISDVRVMSLDRKSGQLRKGQILPGPVWYGRVLDDGAGVLQTSSEPGASLKTSEAQLYVTNDWDRWTKVAAFQKDALPGRYFKLGVLMFPRGKQTLRDFGFFAEALKGVDGRFMVGDASEAVLDRVA